MAALAKDYFYFPYLHIAPLMNRIEDQWHQLMTDEIAGRMFEDEYDLATVIINGMEERNIQGSYTLECFKFNSA